MAVQLHNWDSSTNPGLGQHVSLSKDVEVPRTEVRRKRPYTHSVYVCKACRRAHRKCIHSRTAESSSDDGDSAARNYQTTSGQVRLTREPANRNVSPAIIQFFIDQVAPWFIRSSDGRAMSEEVRLWHVVVPKLALTEPFLYEAMTALCSSFDNCPRPWGFDPDGITTNALANVQSQLSQLMFQANAKSAPIIFLVIAMLASVTMHGPAPLSMLRMHMQGLSALSSHFGEQLIAPQAVTRNLILSSQEASSLNVISQIPFKRRHIMFVDPLLRCIPSEEFQLETAQEGSIFNLLLVANHAIRLWEQKFDPAKHDPRNEMPSCTDKAVNRFFGAYCFYFATHRKNLVMLGNQAFQNYVDLLRNIYEKTIFAILKMSAQASLQRHKVISLSRDLDLLEADLKVAKEKCAIVRLQWPTQVLSDGRSWCEEHGYEESNPQRPAPTPCNQSNTSSDSGYYSNGSVPQLPKDPSVATRYPDDLVPVAELLSAKVELHDYSVDYTYPC